MESYNKDKPSKYIAYRDSHNLYQWAMSAYLPFGGFKWLTQDEIVM